MKSHEESIPHSLLLEEIRLNRKEIGCLSDKVGGKVGRGELFGWLGATATLVGIIVSSV